MSYIKEICQPLIRVLEHSATLPAHLLAGHAANCEFWVGETLHCISVVDDYSARFERLKTAQDEWMKAENINEVRPQRHFTETERAELKRALQKGISSFLKRCRSEEMISQAMLNTYHAHLEITTD